jgi:uncharacterized protein DUF4386
MTRMTNARVAGFTYLAYIALGIPVMILFGGATRGEGMAARLTSIAQHASDMHLAAVLTMCTSFAALVLGVTMYAITRDQDHDLAMLGLACRVGEGVIGGSAIQRSMGLLWLATATGANAPDTESAHGIGAFLLMGQGWNPVISATLFAVGSTLFSWLLLRGRMIPVVLAWLGVLASALLVVGLPLQLAGVLSGSVTQLMWIPMAAFEIPLALWLLIKGVAAPTRGQAAA